MLILRKKAKAEGLDIPNEVMLYIANQIDSNIRELEEVHLSELVAYSSLINKDINADLAAEALKNIIPNSKPENYLLFMIFKKLSEDVYQYKIRRF